MVNNLYFVWGVFQHSMAHGQTFTITFGVSLNQYHIYRGGQFGVGVQSMFHITPTEKKQTTFTIEYGNQFAHTYNVTYEYLLIGY